VTALIGDFAFTELIYSILLTKGTDMACS